MAIIFTKDQSYNYENANSKDIAKLFISNVVLHSTSPDQGNLSRNKYGEIREVSYKGSIGFFEKPNINEVNILKLGQAVGIIVEAYERCKQSDASLGKICFNINDGELEVQVESPNKDCSIDFPRQAMLYLMDEENHQKTNKLENCVQRYLSSVANLNTKTSPEIKRYAGLELANDNPSRFINNIAGCGNAR